MKMIRKAIALVRCWQCRNWVNVDVIPTQCGHCDALNATRRKA